MKNKIDKKGQVTIFIIVGILIVVGIIIAIMLMGGVEVEAPTNLGPRAFIDKCVRDIVEESIETKMLPNGGEITPSHYINYSGDKYNYLCYQADFYQGCYNIHPMLELQIEAEIKKDTAQNIQEMCFNAVKVDFEERGYEVGVGPNGGTTFYSVDLLPGFVRINLEKDFYISKGEAPAQNFKNFDTKVNSPIYELIQIAREVVNSEAQFCHFEYNGYMLLYPKYDIRRKDYTDSKIYNLIDRRSGADFRFAVRSCAFAPGI